jgi:biotin carboxylase
MPELLLLGVGVMGRPYLDAARRLGLRVHAVETPGRAAALDGAVDELTLTKGELDECWAEAAAAAAAKRRPDGVVAFSEPQALPAALLAAEFSLPGPSLHATVLSRNKALQRGCFAAASIRQPEYLITPEVADAADWARSRFPVVVKSLSSSGSLGVESVSDEPGFTDIAARRGGQAVLVERAVDGPEYSWEALVRDGKIWISNLTVKQTSGPPYFIEIGHQLGMPMDGGILAAADELGAGVVAALEMSTGIVHMEFRMAEAGATLMEVAVRTPGDFLMDLLTVSYGIDWFELVIRLAMGMPLPEPPNGPVRCAAAYIPLTGSGVLTAVEGLDAVRANPAVIRAHVLASVGDKVPVARSSSDRRVAVLLSATDHAALQDALSFVRQTLRLRIQPV